jgi:hypothetical protein
MNAIISKRTLSADEVIGQILLKLRIHPHRCWSPLEKLEAFSYNLSMEMTASPASQKPDQMPSERPNEQRATAVETPRNILGKADAQWKKQRGSTPVDVRHLPPHQALGKLPTGVGLLHPAGKSYQHLLLLQQ